MQLKVQTSQIEEQRDLNSEIFYDNYILIFFRLFVYLIFLIKLLEICFFRRKKLRVNDRIQRKYFFAHGFEMIRSFTQDDNVLMNLTLKNTLKNATENIPQNLKVRQSKNEKKVNFTIQKNLYYDPPEFKEQQIKDNLYEIEKQILKFEEEQQIQIPVDEIEIKHRNENQCENSPLLQKIDDMLE